MRIVVPIVAAELALGVLALGSCAPPLVQGMVAITDDPRFFPSHLIVRPGDTVEWRNASAETHIIVATEVPPGAEPFLSPPLAPGAPWRHGFLEPGLYRYGCAIHGAESLSGIIEVR